MTTADDPSPAAAARAPKDAPAEAFAREIQRVANEMFAGTAEPIAPPRLHPSALNVGAGGLSPALSAPPIPGIMHAPPLAASPPPKEADLRPGLAMLSDQLGYSSPFALAADTGLPTTIGPAPGGAMDTPYFLEHAGLPAADGAARSHAAAPAPTFAAAPAGAYPHASARTHAHAGAPAHGSAIAPQVVADATRRGVFDPHAVKREFPILAERVHGKPLVWLDNAATTQKPRAVIDRISSFYEHENSNVHRAAHELAARATDAYEGARGKVRRFLNAPSANEIVFVRGATEAVNLVAQSWGRRNVGPGDEIVITWLEHHANIVPWQQLCCEKGARLRVAPVDDRGVVILEEYERLLGSRTKLVAFTQVSNALGTVVPARAMTAMAHRHGAHVFVDGAQAVSHMPVDVQELDCDFYAFSGHKIFAPTGIGALYGKADVLEHMPPWQGGGNMIADVTFERTSYQAAPARFEAGTGNIADAAGLGAALDWVTTLGLANIARHEHELREYAERELARVPGLRVIGHAPEKAGVISFVVDGMRTEDVGGALDQEGIAVRSGHHCAQPILRRFGLESSVRASLAPYNTREDADSLVNALLRLRR